MQIANHWLLNWRILEMTFLQRIHPHCLRPRRVAGSSWMSLQFNSTIGFKIMLTCLNHSSYLSQMEYCWTSLSSKTSPTVDWRRPRQKSLTIRLSSFAWRSLTIHQPPRCNVRTFGWWSDVRKAENSKNLLIMLFYASKYPYPTHLLKGYSP